MINHLTEDQISRWFIGQSTAFEQRHVQVCRACTAELDRFLGTLESFRTAITAKAERLTKRTSPSLSMVLTEGASKSLGQLLETPSLLVSIKRAVRDTLYPAKVQTTAAPVEVKEIWSRNEFRNSRWLSLLVHAAILALLIIPTALTTPLPSTETLVMIYNKTIPLILDLPRELTSHGGGGGGRKTPTPPSQGVPPPGADKQIVPPMVEAKNLAPDLVVESTIVVPELSMLQALNLQIGDPNGVIGPPSAGPGTGGGIGTGTGTGIGPGRGAGLGPGEGGGIGGGAYAVGGGVSEPRILSQVQPEYSDDARKARMQGTVELLIIVRADGTVQFDSVRKSLGYGLDQKAIEAVKQWKFMPGRKDGRPVPVYVSVLVNFSLR
jgi:periplasmic protein TonB